MGRQQKVSRTVEGRPNFRDVGAGLAMRRLGFADATIASVLGYVPDLDIPASEIERNARELGEQRRRARMGAE